MKLGNARSILILAAGIAALLLAGDLLAGFRGGRGGYARGGSLRAANSWGYRKNSPRLNRYWYGDSYPGESAKSSSDRRIESSTRTHGSLEQSTVPAVPRSAAGVELRELPAGSKELLAGGRRYYYNAGVYYRKAMASGDVIYEVVDAPYAAVVYALPSDYETVKDAGTTYYVVDGVRYRRIMRGGEVAYIVSKTK